MSSQRGYIKREKEGGGGRIVVFEREMERENKEDRWRKEKKMGVGVCVCMHICVSPCVCSSTDPLGSRSCHRDHNRLSCTQPEAGEHACEKNSR